MTDDVRHGEYLIHHVHDVVSRSELTAPSEVIGIDLLFATVEKQRPLEYLRGRCTVSLAVSFSRHSVDLRVSCYDTDVQDLA
jgi:hypothetical protein